MKGVEFLGNAALPVLVLMLGYSLKNIDLSNLSLAVSAGAIRIFGGLAVATGFVMVLKSGGFIGNSPGDLLTMNV